MCVGAALQTMQLGATTAAKEKTKTDTIDLGIIKGLDADSLDNFKTLEEVKTRLAKLIESDFISWFFGFQLNNRMESAFQLGGTFNIEKLQKLGNVLYMKCVVQLPDCEKDGKSGIVFYETEELFLVSNGKNFYMEGL